MKKNAITGAGGLGREVQTLIDEINAVSAKYHFIGYYDDGKEKGTVICTGNILTVYLSIKDYVTLNLACTIGHGTILENFVSLMPAVNVSDEVVLNEAVYVGTGAKIINPVSVEKNTTIVAGAVVSKSLPENCTAVGIAAKPIKFYS
jgi:acetyltransferase-like isoleucine patch superfamily enzyme